MIFDFTVSVTHVITVLGFVGALASNWFILKNRVDKALEEAIEAQKKASEATNSINSLERQLIREYTSLQHMQSVETRLSSQIGELTSEIRELRRFLMDKKQ